MIVDGFFVHSFANFPIHCFAEWFIFLGSWNALRCIFRTLFCIMIYLVQDCQMDFSYTVLQKDTFVQDLQMTLDGFSVHCFAQWSIFQDFQMILDGFFVHCFAEWSIFQDFQMILEGFFVHCFAEWAIFPGVSDDFRWIFRTLFCRMIHFSKIFRWF